MIAILYPLKMDKNLSEAYSSIYEVSADLAIKAAKGAEKKRAESAKAGDTEGAKKAMGQNKKFFDYAKGKRQKENMPKKPTGPMANKPMPDPTSSYPGTPQIMKQGKMVKSSYEPEDNMVEGTKDMKKFLDDKAKKLTKQRDAQPDAYKNNPHFDSTNPTSKSRTEAYDAQDDAVDQIMGGGKRDAQKDAVKQYVKYSSKKKKKMKNEAYDNRYSDNTGKESKEKLKKLEKKRGMSLKGHPQFTRDDVGKFRKEWEALKLVESDNYREQFDTWLNGIVEEGYDIDRWTDEELLDTFINENDLWESRESVSEALLSEADKKGKGSGKKDACYHKVKASASVWPSAYASGRLVQCRKKGAANYGNSKKEDFSDWRSDIQLDELNKQERMETAKRGGGGVGKRFAKKTIAANKAGKGKLFGGYDHRGTGNVGRRNINRFESEPVEREDGKLDKKRRQSFTKVKVLNPAKKGGRTLNKFGSDFQDDYRSKDGLRATQSDHAQKKRREEHEKRRGVKTKGTVASDIKKALKD